MSTRDELNSYIGQLQRRLRLSAALRGAAILAGTALATTIVLVLILNAFAFSRASVGGARVLLFGGLLVVLGFFLAIPLARLSRRNVVGKAENLFPQFQQRLITFAERDQNGQNHSEPFLDLLAADTLEAAQGAEPEHAAPNGKLMALIGAGAASLAVLFWMIFAGPGFMGYGSSLLWAGAKHNAAPFYSIKVTPGDVTVRRNADQLVTALPVGLQAAKVQLYARYQSASKWEQVSMQPQPGAAGFQFLFAGLPEGVEYYVEAGAVVSPHFKIHVIDMPGVKKIRVTYHYPRWAGFKDVSQEQGGDLRAVQGTNAELEVLMDRPLRDGMLVIDNQQQIPLTGGAGNVYKATIHMEKDGVYHVAALDHGQPVRLSGDYFIAAAQPTPPEVAIARPARDYRASPIEEVTVSAHAEDDYGLSSLELHYSVNGGPEQTANLLKDKGAKEADGSTVLSLEKFKMVPGDVISLYATAKDARTDARTDIFFIQADPFEREFSQSQTAGGGGGGGGQQNNPDDISQREKEIIAATWKQQGDKGPAQLQASESAKFLSETQAKLAAQARSLANRMQSRELSQANDEFNSFVADMNSAAQAMDPAAGKLKERKWQEAMPSEQKALQNLLRAESTFRQIEVAFGSRGGGGGGGAGRDLASLFDLELDTQKNQYETAQTAGAATPHDQQVDEALKKLDELARRQQALADQQNGNTAQSFQQRWQQELLRRNAEQLQRQLEQLAQNNPQGQQGGQQGQQSNQQSSQQSGQSGQQSGQPGGQQSGGGQSGQQSGAQGSQGQSSQGQAGSNQSRASSQQSREAARRALEQLRQATGDMLHRSPSQQQSAADARAAADRLREATNLLAGAQQQQASGRLDAMAREADQLRSEQAAQDDQMRKAEGQQGQQGGANGSRGAARAAGQGSQEQFADARQRLSDELSQLRAQMQNAEQELAGTQRPAAAKLRDALNGMEQSDLTTRVQRSADWLRRGIDPNSNSMYTLESGIRSDLERLSQQVQGAQQALGSGQQPGTETASNQSALNEVQRLRDQLQALGPNGRGRNGQQQGQSGRPGQAGQGRQTSQLGRGSQPGQAGQPGQSGQNGQAGQPGQNGQNGQAGQPGQGGQNGDADGTYSAFVAGGRNNRGGLVYGGLDTGNNSELPQPVAPDNSPTPADQQAVIQQGVSELNQLRQSLGDDPEALRQVQELIREMQGLDPSRFRGNLAVLDALHTQVLNDVDKLEVRLQAKGDQSGQIRSTDKDAVPSGYQDAVAEYFRKLSKNQ